MSLHLNLRIFVAILALGAYSQIVQAILIREALVVFHGSEITLGLFFASWLLWVAVGSLSLRWLRHARWVARPLSGLWGLLALLPLLLVLQVLALRLVRLAFDLSAAEFIPLGGLFTALLLITIPSSIILGMAFPLACRALEQARTGVGIDVDERHGDDVAVGGVVGLYVADALGALAGGVTFTFVLIRWFGVVGSIAGLTLLLGLVLWSLANGRRRRQLLAALLVVLGLLPLATPVGPRLDRELEVLRFATLQPGLELLDALETRYGHVAISRLGEQYSVVRDGRISETFPQPKAVAREAAFVAAQAAGAKRVLLVGGGVSGLAGELLRYPVTDVDLIEEDQLAFAHIRPYLPDAEHEALADPRLRLHFGDGRRTIARLPDGQRFDLVLVLNADPSSAYGNRYFTQEFYRQVRARLSVDGAMTGVFCTSLTGAANYLGSAVVSYTSSVYATLKSVFPEVAVMPGDQQVYCAAMRPGQVSEDAAELARRYRATPLSPRHFPADSFHALLDPERVRFVHERLDQHPGAINTDARPVTYYLNMVLWGKFSGSLLVDGLQQLRRLGAWPWLLPVVLFIVLWLLRAALEGFARSRMQGRAATLALVVLGAVAMAVQLLVLFAYQAQVGFVFERIALLDGVFMTGLALGAGVGRRLAGSERPCARNGAALMANLLLVALALLLLPEALQGLQDQANSYDRWYLDTAYLGLSATLGLATGLGFPLAFALVYRDRPRLLNSSGLVQAADNLGGALGGLLTGAFLVPILGIMASSYLLAGLTLLAILPLAFAGFVRKRPAWLAVRGGRAFPWSGLGWTLSYCALLAFAWMQLQHVGQAPPRVHFQEQRLHAVADAEQFEERQTPFVYYLGQTKPNGTVAALSTLAAAAEVRGYAGPLNLLVAVDDQGHLQGASYVDSTETPSYITGIDAWLAGLSGHDLSRAPLSRQGVDGLSGATVTSRAALEAIDRSVRRVGRVAFEREFAPEEVSAASPGWRTPGFAAVSLLLLLFFPVYLSGSDRARLLFQATTLGVLGLWLNSLLTEVDWVNLSMGHWPDPVTNPLRWLLIGFVAVTALLFGPVWCGYCCPFGALQEFVSRLGRWLRLRAYPGRPLDIRARFLKFVLLAVMSITVWLTADPGWATFDPMQYVFGLTSSARMAAWMMALIVVVLLGALVHYRFWCRYFCPLGALLALSNKLALLQRLAPKRRFNHCDLGVREEFDIDCIRCNRCISHKP